MTDRVIDVDQVRKGRTMLWIALAGSLLLVPSLMGKSPGVLFLVAWVASFFGGIGGIREVARGTQGSALLMFGSMVLVFMPVFNVLPIALYLLIARGALREDAESSPAPVPQPKPAPRARTAAPAPPPGSGPAIVTKPGSVAGAIACIKQAGLRSADGSELKDGTRLGMRFKLPEGAPPMNPRDEPVMLVAHGTFGVVYLVDQGDHYTWVTVGQLMDAKLKLEDLHRIGLKNLELQARELMIAMGDDAYMMTMGGQFEASMLLVDSVWDKTVAEYTPNGAIATIPARDMCVFCDARSAEGLKRVQAVATNPLADASHALTTRLFARRDGRWREFAATDPRDAPLEFRA